MKSITSVFLLCLLRCGASFQTEFVRSFITRPWMLSNASFQDPSPDFKQWNQATLSIYMDNWSPHNLKLIGDEIRSGTFSTGLLPHDHSQYSRELALRSLSSKEAEKTSGLVSWILVENESKLKLAVLTLAWQVGNGIESQFSLKLSDEEPTFEDMWAKSSNNRMASTNQLDNTVYVGGMAQLRFVAAANMTMNEGDTLHYRLRVSLVPSNIDVWGWVKYYREPYEVSLTQKKTKNNKPTKVTTTDTQERQELALYEKKELLDNDTALEILNKKNLTLRKALAFADSSIALGIRLENWSAYPLSPPVVELKGGKIFERNDTLPAPGSVQAGHVNVGMIVADKVLTGTSGVIRWTLGSTNLVLSLMWSVPYNRQLWRTWIAVGLTEGQDKSSLPTYDEMYKSDDDSKFIRRQAGHRFEFSDGKFIVIADMDGDATFKPILRVGLVPRNNDILAANVRQRLGMKPSLFKPSDFNYQKTQQHDKRQQRQQDDMPAVGLVQTGNSCSRTLSSVMSVVSMFIPLVVFNQ